MLHGGGKQATAHVPCTTRYTGVYTMVNTMVYRIFTPWFTRCLHGDLHQASDIWFLRFAIDPQQTLVAVGNKVRLGGA